MQWIPAHCGLLGNERADVLAKQDSSLHQDDVRSDVHSIGRAVIAPPPRHGVIADRTASNKSREPGCRCRCSRSRGMKRSTSPSCERAAEAGRRATCIALALYGTGCRPSLCTQ